MKSNRSIGWLRVALASTLVVVASAWAQDETFVPRTEYRYAGDANVTIHHLDEVHQLEATRTYVHEVVVLLGPPRRFGREVEANPVHLEILPRSSAAQHLEGQVGLSSASTNDGLQQHWTLQLEVDRLEGTLTTVEQGTLSLILDEVNHLNSRRRMGYTGFATDATSYDTLAHGTSLTGRVSEEAVLLHVEGNVTSGDRPFRLVVNASRVDMLGQPLPPRDHEVEREPAPAPTPAPDADDRTLDVAPPVGEEPEAQAVDEVYVGRFEGPELTLTLERGGGGVMGELVFRGEAYPVNAAVKDGRLQGTFVSAGQAFPFEAELLGGVLTLRTAGTQYVLERALEAPRNPLGR